MNILFQLDTVLGVVVNYDYQKTNNSTTNERTQMRYGVAMQVSQVQATLLPVVR